MIKRILIIIGLLIPMHTTYAQLNATESIISQTINSFNSPENNLYYDIYNSIHINTNNLTVQRVSKQLNVPEDTLERFFIQEEITPQILEMCKNISRVESENQNLENSTDIVEILSAEHILACKEKIAQAYNFEKNLAELEVQMQQEFNSSEIWSNGSLSDSSFDLIVDLNVIEFHLFGEKFSVSQTPINEIESNTPPPFAPIDLTPINEENGETPTLDTPFSDIINGEDVLDITIPENNLICIDPEILDLKAFEPLENNISNTLDIDTLKNIENILQDTKGAEFSNLENSIARNIGENCKNGIPLYGGLICVPEAAWCSGANLYTPFIAELDFSACVNLEFTISNVEAANKEINCVNCHVENINEILDELLGFNIVPTKNTKQAWEITHQYLDGIVAGFSFITLSKPVFNLPRDTFSNSSTSNGEQAMNTYSVLEEYEKFQRELLKKQGIFNQNEIAPDIFRDEKLLQKTGNFSETETIFNAIENNEQLLEENFNIFLTNYYNANTLKNNQNYWEAIDTEMEKMNTYFASFQEMLNMMGHETNAEGLSKKLIQNAQTQCR